MRLICILMLATLLHSCTQESADQLFVPLPEMTEDVLLKQGYNRVWGVDVLMYEKRINDVLFQYQFYDDDGQELGYQTWAYENVSFNDDAEYDTKLRELGFMPMTTVSLDQRVAISSHKTNGLYTSLFFPKNKELRISYDHPTTK